MHSVLQATGHSTLLDKEMIIKTPIPFPVTSFPVFFKLIEITPSELLKYSLRVSPRLANFVDLICSSHFWIGCVFPID